METIPEQTLVCGGVLRAYGTDGRTADRGIPVYCMKEPAILPLLYTAQTGGAVYTLSYAAGRDRWTEQVCLLYRASAAGRILAVVPDLLLPSPAEMVRGWADDGRRRLLAEGDEIGQVPLGISVGTPSAAVLADLLAPLCDFLVLDTGGLMHALSEAGYGAHLPDSVRRCIRMTVSAAQREGVPLLEKVP